MKVAFYFTFRGPIFGGGLIFGGKFVLVIRGLIFKGLHSGFYDIWLEVPILGGKGLSST